jgi:hypothetical protein
MQRSNDRRLEQLRPIALPPDLEAEARALGEDICCGSRSMWPLDAVRMKSDDEYRRQFYSLAHDGMWEAQSRFLRRIDASTIKAPEELLFRTAMDTIAWQLLENQLVFVRKLFRGGPSPNLNHSNLHSVVRAASWLRKQHPGSMPLISDLTTFVQVGDILSMVPGEGLTIVEVKEGDHNNRVLGLAHALKVAPSENRRAEIRNQHGPKTYAQVERVVRQMHRMEFATSMLGSRPGVDPDTGHTHHVPTGYLHVPEWHEELNQTISESMERGWSINVIDDCLFIGCYASRQAMNSAPLAFLPWLDHFSGNEKSMVVRMLDFARLPLSLPLYLLPMPHERLIDLMFGRLHICLGFSLTQLVAECHRHGIAARPATKQERKLLITNHDGGVPFAGQPLVFERDSHSIVVSDGIFIRMLCNFQRPVALISALLDVEAKGEAALSPKIWTSSKPPDQ